MTATTRQAMIASLVLLGWEPWQYASRDWGYLINPSGKRPEWRTRDLADAVRYAVEPRGALAHERAIPIIVSMRRMGEDLTRGDWQALSDEALTACYGIIVGGAFDYGYD